MNNIRTIYLYVVAFVTLGMIITGIVVGVSNMTEYFFPTSYVFFEDEYDDYTYDDSYNSYSFQEPDQSEVAENEIEKENYKTERIKGIVVSIAILIIGSVMYKYHWNMIQNERSK